MIFQFKTCVLLTLLILATYTDPTKGQETPEAPVATTTTETPVTTTTTEAPVTTTTTTTEVLVTTTTADPTTTTSAPTTTTEPPTTTPVVPFPRTRCLPGATFTCKDCQNLYVCDGRTNVVGTLSCQRNNPNTPYCSNEQCSPTQDAQCIKSSLLCPAEGYYPHPFNCNRYNICTANRQAYEVSCPANWVYSHGLQACRPRTQASDCVVSNCAWNNGLTVAYPGDSSLYVFCGGGANNMLLQCPANTFYDPIARSCGARICTAEGLFPFPGDNTKYYVCVQVNGELQHYVAQCPGNLVFNTTSNRCAVN